MKKIIAVLLVCFYSMGFSQSPPSAQTLNTITTAVPFLLITPDARAGALGDAGCASTPDVYSNYWNIAKNSFVTKKNGLSFSWTPWLRALVPDMNLFSGSFYKRIGNQGVIGFSATYFDLGKITFTNVVGNPIGQFRPYEHSESITYSTKFTDNFSVGCGIKYIYSNLTGNLNITGSQTHPGRDVAFDFLSLYKKDTINTRDVWAWGLNISTIGSKISYSFGSEGDFLPANLRIGTSYKWNVHPQHSVEFILDADKLLVPTPDTSAIPNQGVVGGAFNSFNDAPGGVKEELHEIMIASGIEYWCYKTVAARAGYFYEHETKGGRKYFTVGLGGRYKGLELNASYLFPIEDRHPLGHTLRLTASWEFSTQKRKKDLNFVG